MEAGTRRSLRGQRTRVFRVSEPLAFALFFFSFFFSTLAFARSPRYQMNPGERSGERGERETTFGPMGIYLVSQNSRGAGLFEKTLPGTIVRLAVMERGWREDDDLLYLDLLERNVYALAPCRLEICHLARLRVPIKKKKKIFHVITRTCTIIRKCTRVRTICNIYL